MTTHTALITPEEREGLPEPGGEAIYDPAAEALLRWVEITPSAERLSAWPE